MNKSLFFVMISERMKCQPPRRKIDDEGRAYISVWCSKYLVIPHNQGVVCSISQNTIAVMKEYNVKRYYATKHSSQYDEFLGQARVDKIKHKKIH